MLNVHVFFCSIKGKGSPYSITERRVPELIPVLGSQPTGDVSHKPDGRLPLLSARPAITLATIKRAATSFGAWWTEARWVWTVCLRLLPDSVAAAIWTQAFVHLSQHANHSATEPPSVVIVICRSFQPVNYNIVGRVRSAGHRHAACLLYARLRCDIVWTVPHLHLSEAPSPTCVDLQHTIIIIIAMTVFMVLSSWPKSLREFTRFIWWM